MNPTSNPTSNLTTGRATDPATPQLHVIVGAGAVGRGTARQLADAGHRVRLISRSGSGPSDRRLELVAADAADADRLIELADGAHAIYNCANPPYHRWSTAWPPLAASLLAAAEATGARLITMSNLYGYPAESSPMSATDELDAPTRKGAVRVSMWEQALAAHRAGRVRVSEARASDFFGPGLGDSAHLGDRVLPRLVRGKSISVLGKPDVVHSWSYIDDVCRTLAVLGTDDRALGRAWHVPTAAPRTVEEMAAAVCAAAGVSSSKVRSIPTSIVRIVGLFSPIMRELPEMLYQFERPFVIDASDTTAVFGLEATPFEAQIDTTVAAQRANDQGVAAPTVASAA